MLFWYGHHHGGPGWGWLGATVGMVLFWALVIVIGVLIFRALTRPGAFGAAGPGRRVPGWRQDAAPPAGPPTAEQILAERYARGEIEDDEYQRRLAVLRSGTGGPTRPPDAPAK
ncbi:MULTISPECIES: SHOCT domain-containing protein [unclassified Streptomyces]|uniref:SHOCT domain-containing protein n=1 Tax=unclassified Streptomyces TaxID=2593676 RepID=UPI00037FE63B|nr:MULTISPECIES: SHOCT domain-containing protein [unclassified Streptomyces]